MISCLAWRHDGGFFDRTRFCRFAPPRSHWPQGLWKETSMTQQQARFRVGQPIHHRLFGYRGVVIDVDACFQGSEDWYAQMARTRPPKDRPWYHVLVHDGDHRTYVAERNLEPDLTGKPIAHPALSQFFDAFENGLYVSRRATH
jgi:heat shock protein HspQ